MTDLKELIEREMAGFLDWSVYNKSIVTTTNAKRFAEHVARLYAESRPAPDVAQLVEALEELSTAWRELQSENDGVYQDAIAALSAYREQQGAQP